ncbi:ELMO domain-containing protein 2 [Trypanosoma grayi]|uniref:ELMO domain-containing protein 2 n=1 Tax=Trypanosoma grayi TaxID=71804 RepID=UPI0004F45494|nr:ELMO domain-containing protein 2 [Trypanosoma grayi]KEG08858.1 ELMO domain-containing protein 2 [Trypanosoma grayi]
MPLRRRNGPANNEAAEPLIRCADAELAQWSDTAATSTEEESSFDPWRRRIVTILGKVLDVLPAALTVFLRPDLQERELRALAALQERYVCPWDAANEIHVQLLTTLWRSHWRCMRKDVPPLTADMSSERWKELGFQDKHPATDFRGAGLLSLRQLIYVVETYPREWITAIQTPNYFAAATGINVTMRLLVLLQIGTGLSCLEGKMARGYTLSLARVNLSRMIYHNNTEVALQRLNEVYCACMRRVWMSWETSSKNIMLFNALLDACFVEMEEIINVSSSLEEFCALM